MLASNTDRPDVYVRPGSPCRAIRRHRYRIQHATSPVNVSRKRDTPSSIPNTTCHVTVNLSRKRDTPSSILTTSSETSARKIGSQRVPAAVSFGLYDVTAFGSLWTPEWFVFHADLHKAAIKPLSLTLGPSLWCHRFERVVVSHPWPSILWYRARSHAGVRPEFAS